MAGGHIAPFKVAVCWDGMVAAVTVTGQVDSTTAPALARRLLEVAAARPERLAVDLGGLIFTDVASARTRSRLQGTGETVPSHPAGAPPRLHRKGAGHTGLTGRPGHGG